jgi:hypothetical protein
MAGQRPVERVHPTYRAADDRPAIDAQGIRQRGLRGDLVPHGDHGNLLPHSRPSGASLDGPVVPWQPPRNVSEVDSIVWVAVQ